MTSQVLARLERQMKLKREQAPPPGGNSDLGSAIADLIDRAVEQRLEEAAKKMPPVNPRVPPYLRDFTDKAELHEFPPPTPTTKAPRDMTLHVQRGETGRIETFTIGNNEAKFQLQRDARGRTVRVVQLD